jgi:hypothetical protein
MPISTYYVLYNKFCSILQYIYNFISHFQFCTKPSIIVQCYGFFQPQSKCLLLFALDRSQCDQMSL